MKFILLFAFAALVVGAIVFLAAGKAHGNKSKQTMKNQTDEVGVRLLQAGGTLTDVIRLPRVIKTDEQWRAQLTPRSSNFG